MVQSSGRSLRRELKKKNLTYWFDTTNFKEVVDLKIGYSKGYFQFYIPRDRLTTSSARLFGLWITLPALLMIAVAIIFLLLLSLTMPAMLSKDQII